MPFRQYDPTIGRFIAIDAMAESFEDYTTYHYSNNSPLIYSDPTGLYPEKHTTWVINGDTNERFWIDDGYHFDFVVNSDDFTEIKNSGAIPKRLNWAWNKEFWRQVWAGVVNSDGSASDEITAFLITDTADETLSIINEVQQADTNVAALLAVINGALKIGSGKLKKLKKLARWAKKNPNRKIPGTKKGGVKFENNDGKLPKTDKNGKKITYTEYDINKAPQHGATRGKERMVIGSDGKNYYTRDHYQSFREFKD